MWGYLYPDTDATGTVRGLATPTPRQANLAAERWDKAIRQFEQAKTISEKKWNLTLQHLTPRGLRYAKRRR